MILSDLPHLTYETIGKYTWPINNFPIYKNIICVSYL